VRTGLSLSHFVLLVEWGFRYAELMEMELGEIAGWYREVVSILKARAARTA